MFSGCTNWPTLHKPADKKKRPAAAASSSATTAVDLVGDVGDAQASKRTTHLDLVEEA